MEPQKQKTSAKDFFLNFGAIIALYTVVVSLLNLIFTVINTVYPQITSNYYGNYSASISFPVSTLIIFFPVFILLMWLLAKPSPEDLVARSAEGGFRERKWIPIRKWLTYITLFIAGLTLAGDLVTVLYYFIDGQELTTGFLLKIFSVLVIILMVFLYYISDIRNKLTSTSKKVWLSISIIIILFSIIWGFSVLGSPRTQQLIKYDEHKVSDLQNLNMQVQDYYQRFHSLPSSFRDLLKLNYGGISIIDTQIKKPYEYNIVDNLSYEVCAIFNKSSNLDSNQTTYVQYGNLSVRGSISWTHPSGRYCFSEKATVTTAPIPVVQ